MTYIHRCMVIPVALIAQVRGMAAVLGVPPSTWSRDLAAPSAPTVPVAVMGSGGVLEELALLLPCTEWHLKDAGAWESTAHYPGQAQGVADAVGASVEAVQAVLSAVDVSTQDPDAALARIGLVFATQPGDSDGPV